MAGGLIGKAAKLIKGKKKKPPNKKTRKAKSRAEPKEPKKDLNMRRNREKV